MRLYVLMIVVLTVFSGCGSQDKTLVMDDRSNFVVVGQADKNYVSTVASKINTLIGVEPQIYTAETAPEGKAQIWIGDPSDLAVGELMEEVPYFGYLVTARNGNVYILAYHDDVLAEAATVFLQSMEGWTSKGKIRVEKGYEVKESISKTFPEGDVPYLEGSENASVHDYGNQHQVVSLEDVDKAEFSAYCEKLKAEGYHLYAENEINGNLFMTYQNDSNQMIHTYWLERYEEVRTVVANTERLPFTSNAQVDANCTPVLHQMEGVDEQGHIIRLADGRFIIVDGGEPTEENAVEIYTFLKENAPDPQKIVIAAWYITHAHSDHCGALAMFAEKYSSDSSILLETILFNHCETTEQMFYCEPSYRLNMEVALAEYYPNVPVFKPLTGQVFTFGKTTIEILYTMSDFMPNTIAYEVDGKGGDYNVMSSVCIIDIDSTADRKDRWFVMGDTTTVACNEMCYRYGDYMKSDFVQMSHHGLTPLPTGTNCRRHCATVEIYELIDPSVALWPASVEKAKERSPLEVNDYLLSIVDQVVIAGEGGYTFEIQ